MNETKLAQENLFIHENRFGFAQLGPDQYQKTGETGVILVEKSSYEDTTGEIKYLSEQIMEDYGLLNSSATIARSVQSALKQYDPSQEVIILFLYPRDGTVYLLDIQHDLLSQ